MLKDGAVCRTFIFCFLLYHYTEDKDEPNAMQPGSLKGILIQPTYIELLKYAMCWAGFMDKKGNAVFSLSRKKKIKRLLYSVKVP